MSEMEITELATEIEVADAMIAFERIHQPERREVVRRLAFERDLLRVEVERLRKVIWRAYDKINGMGIPDDAPLSEERLRLLGEAFGMLGRELP
jgi:hypothetical protein